MPVIEGGISPELRDWIEAQHVFFVATAPLAADGHVNVSPKGGDTFRILDEHLWFGEQEGRDWICSADHPTLADIACFPYVMLSEEGGISRQDYPAIRRWCDRVKRIKGFIVMSGVFPAGPAKAA